MLPRILSCAACLGCLALGSMGLGCATTHDPDPAADDLTESEQAAELDEICELAATVTVRVDNESSTDVRIAFGSYRPARPALGFSRTAYQVPRTHLQDWIRLSIAAGGLQIGTPPPVQTEPVICNDATLIIGGGVRHAFFYGDKLRDLKPKHETSG